MVSSIEGGVGRPLARKEVGDRSRDGEAQSPQLLWQASRISELSSHCPGVTPLQADAGKVSLWASAETPPHPSEPAPLLAFTPASMHGGSVARALPSEGKGEGDGDTESFGIVATPLAKSLTGPIGADWSPGSTEPKSAVPSSDSPMSGASSCRVGDGDGTGKDEGEGVDWQDESLQLPLSSVLNSCAAHQDFAHEALSQMNLQSDAIAARGGSYLAYQSFMSVCSCTRGAAKSLQPPLSSALNSFATHQPSLLHMNRQSDARAARGGSYTAYQASMPVQCSRTQLTAGEGDGRAGTGVGARDRKSVV